MIRKKLFTQYQRLNLTGAELSRRSGLPRTTVHRFLNDEASITTETAERLAKALGLKITVTRKAK